MGLVVKYQQQVTSLVLILDYFQEKLMAIFFQYFVPNLAKMNFPEKKGSVNF